MLTAPNEKNFDQWYELSQQDPDKFEAMRQALVNEALAKMPTQRRERLRGLQWQIDNIRQRSQSPLGCCIRISEMMWDSLSHDYGLLNLKQNLLEDPPEELYAGSPSADIIPLGNYRNATTS